MSLPELWVLFDFRIPKTGCEMRRMAYAWKSRASFERLDAHHAVLVIRPGGAVPRPRKRAA